MADNSNPGEGAQGIYRQVAGDMNRIVGLNPDEVQSYANQLTQCRSMRQHLVDLDAGILQITQAFYQALLQLQTEEYMGEELQNLARMLSEIGPMAEDLSQHLRMRHMVYIDDRARQVTLALAETQNQG